MIQAILFRIVQLFLKVIITIVVTEYGLLHMHKFILNNTFYVDNVDMT